MIIYSRKGFTLVEIMITVVIIALILAIGLPNYVRMLELSRKNTCIVNLYQLEGAISAWAIDNSISNGTSVNTEQEDSLYSYIKGTKPACPSKGSYAFGQVGIKPQVRCSLEDRGHKLPE
jgi:prepilin-type N-terminal cleavage/methylation domain-containing protein